MRTKLLEVPRCNPLKDKDIVSYRSSCPPCRRFRSNRHIFHGDGSVVRRVGGLEVSRWKVPHHHIVVRRVGGLEAPEIRLSATVGVVRRVGGLEVLVLLIWLSLPVVRRVGGLEGVGGITCESSAIDEETEAR